MTPTAPSLTIEDNFYIDLSYPTHCVVQRNESRIPLGFMSFYGAVDAARCMHLLAYRLSRRSSITSSFPADSPNLPKFGDVPDIADFGTHTLIQVPQVRAPIPSGNMLSVHDAGRFHGGLLRNPCIDPLLFPAIYLRSRS